MVHCWFMTNPTLRFLSTVCRLASHCAWIALGCSTYTVLMMCYADSELGTVRLPLHDLMLGFVDQLLALDLSGLACASTFSSLLDPVLS